MLRGWNSQVHEEIPQKSRLRDSEGDDTVVRYTVKPTTVIMITMTNMIMIVIVIVIVIVIILVIVLVIIIVIVIGNRATESGKQLVRQAIIADPPVTPFRLLSNTSMLFLM